MQITNNTTSRSVSLTTGDIVLFGVTSLLNAVGIALHCFGIFLFRKLKPRDQRPSDVIITDLSVMEIFMAISLQVWLVTLAMSDQFNESTFNKRDVTLWIIVNLPMMSTMIFLTIDRVLAVWLLLKYSSVCTKGRYIKVIILFWVFAVITAGVTYGTMTTVTKNTMPLAIMLVDFAYMLIAGSSYVYIIIAAYMQRRAISNNTNQMQAVDLKYKVPLAIMTTYFLMMVIPHAFIYFWGVYLQGRSARVVLNMLGTFNTISDAGIYIYFQPKMRTLATAIVNKCCKTGADNRAQVYQQSMANRQHNPKRLQHQDRTPTLSR